MPAPRYTDAELWEMDDRYWDAMIQEREREDDERAYASKARRDAALGCG